MIIRVKNLPARDRERIPLCRLAPGQLAVVVHVAQWRADDRAVVAPATCGEVVMRGAYGRVSTLGEPEYVWREDVGHRAVLLQPTDDIVVTGA